VLDSLGHSIASLRDISLKMVNSEDFLENSVTIDESILDNLVINLDTTREESLNYYTGSEVTETSIQHLPEEVLQKVFAKLPLKSLANAAAVCFQWRRICEWPGFWAKLRLSVKPTNLQASPQVLALPRLAALKRLRIRQVNQPLFQEILSHRGLRELDLRFTDLSSIPPNLLAGVLSKMEVVVMFSSKLEKEQSNALMEVLTQPSSKLKTLNIGDNWLSGVKPKVFASAVSKLEHLEVAETGLTAPQASALLEVVSAGESRLKTLNISNNWLAEVSPNLLAKGLSSLEHVEARRCDFNQEQLVNLLHKASASNSRIQKLDIGGNRAARDLSTELIDAARTAVRHLQLSTAGLPIVGS